MLDQVSSSCSVTIATGNSYSGCMVDMECRQHVVSLNKLTLNLINRNNFEGNISHRIWQTKRTARTRCAEHYLCRTGAQSEGPSQWDAADRAHWPLQSTCLQGHILLPGFRFSWSRRGEYFGSRSHIPPPSSGWNNQLPDEDSSFCQKLCKFLPYHTASHSILVAGLVESRLSFNNSGTTRSVEATSCTGRRFAASLRVTNATDIMRQPQQENYIHAFGPAHTGNQDTFARTRVRPSFDVTT